MHSGGSSSTSCDLTLRPPYYGRYVLWFWWIALAGGLIIGSVSMFYLQKPYAGLTALLGSFEFSVTVRTLVNLCAARP